MFRIGIPEVRNVKGLFSHRRRYKWNQLFDRAHGLLALLVVNSVDYAEVVPLSPTERDHLLQNASP